MTTASVGSCCAALYGHPLARFLLGDSYHPGGLAMTDELARMADAGPSDDVLDAGSGPGTSAVHIAETLGARVTGVTLEAAGVEAGRRLAAERGVSSQTDFLQGDVLELAASLGPFEVVLLECVLSTLPDKAAALRKLAARLKPGGRIAVSDVTIEGPLPEALQGTASAALCLGDALSFEGYCSLLCEPGLLLREARPAGDVAAKFVRQLRGGLLIAEAAGRLGMHNVSSETVAAVRAPLKIAHKLVEDGRLGYALFVAVRDW
ncbi:MAG: methyltransferase domain-containing protein [Chloroflexi bacterium]|nr:methyltransferase domain-containing protein [Chloroflexota bacterium]